MNLRKKIENYGEDISDFNTSPFEALEMLHVRSHIEEYKNELSEEEATLLRKYDQQLLNNADRMYKHISKAYDFSLSKEPFTE